MSVQIRAVEWDDPASVSLREAQQSEIAARYGSPDSEPGVKPSAADITVFFVAFDDEGKPLGCGGLRRLDATEAEVKRMFVAPAHRGSGVSTAILARLEDFGRELGLLRLVLETGTLQPDAIRFYEREGYTPIPNFGSYADSPLSLCFEKPLLAIDPQSELGCEGCE